MILITQKRHTDHWSRVESPEINPHNYSHLIYDEEARMYDGEKRVFNKWCWESWKATGKLVKF